MTPSDRDGGQPMRGQPSAETLKRNSLAATVLQEMYDKHCKAHVGRECSCARWAKARYVLEEPRP